MFGLFQVFSKKGRFKVISSLLLSNTTVLKEFFRRHRKYHDIGNRKHSCSCGMAFLHPEDLRRHNKTHDTDTSSLECPADQCKSVFGRNDNLKRHISKQHPNFDVSSANRRQRAPYQDCNERDIDEENWNSLLKLKKRRSEILGSNQDRKRSLKRKCAS